MSCHGPVGILSHLVWATKPLCWDEDVRYPIIPCDCDCIILGSWTVGMIIDKRGDQESTSHKGKYGGDFIYGGLGLFSDAR